MHLYLHHINNILRYVYNLILHFLLLFYLLFYLIIIMYRDPILGDVTPTTMLKEEKK